MKKPIILTATILGIAVFMAVAVFFYHLGQKQASDGYILMPDGTHVPFRNDMQEDQTYPQP